MNSSINLIRDSRPPILTPGDSARFVKNNTPTTIICTEISNQGTVFYVCLTNQGQICKVHESHVYDHCCFN